MPALFNYLWQRKIARMILERKPTMTDAPNPPAPQPDAKGWTGRKCQRCHGIGETYRSDRDSDGPCLDCGGTGEEWGLLQKPDAQDEKPIWEQIADIGAKIPESELSKFPAADASNELSALRERAERAEAELRWVSDIVCGTGLFAWPNRHPVECSERLAETASKLKVERDELAEWKRQALAVEFDRQKVAALLGVRLGESIHDKIVPGIERLIAERDDARAEYAKLKGEG